MQTTRLHISGLTPSISANDLKQRFSTFGDVRDIDGVGKLDGVGRPRKFAHLTLETTQPKLARCMNLLSGSTWKGAKLRIGEAKHDFRARYELEMNPSSPPPRPKLDALARKRARLKQRLRTRRLLPGTQGKHAKDMSPVTLNNVAKRKGWRRTPLDHLIHPMRMRPLRPLPPLPSKHPRPLKFKTKKKQQKRKFELTRARCTVIDPARYGAVHLTGDGGLLGAEVLVEREDPEVSLGRNVELVENGTRQTLSPPHSVSKPGLVAELQIKQPHATLLHPTQSSSTTHAADLSSLLSLAKEKADTLVLLGGMFGSGEWGGKESVSEEEGPAGSEMDVEQAVDYEVVPKDTGDEITLTTQEAGEDVDSESADDAETIKGDDEAGEGGQAKESLMAPIKYNPLKEMFKPQEDTGGFSLGLDIELDPENESLLPVSLMEPGIHSQPEPVPRPALTIVQKHSIQFTPDPKAIMFFPGSRSKRDVFSVIRERGWEWPHPGTPDEIRAKWDKSKAELTKEYVRRHREGVKRRRRGGGFRTEEV